jgi:regulator of sigma E protease
MLTVLSFVLGLGLLIAVHEYGHYRMARACGVRVIRFSIGFGKPLVCWRFYPYGTEFVIAMIPLGGFVKMLDEREEPVDPTERHLAFNTQRLRNRALIVLAGPLANLLLAVVIYTLVGWWGVPEPKAVLATPVPGSVADVAGLRAGDWVVSARVADENPKPVPSFDNLRWVLTQAVLNRDDVVLSLSAQENGPEHKIATLRLSDLEAHNADAALFQQIGLLGPFSPPLVNKIVPGGPGEIAGLQEGDWVRKVGDTAVIDAQQLRDAIRQAIRSPGQSASQVWTVERSGVLLTLPVSPQPELKDGVWIGRVGVFLGGPPAMSLVSTHGIEGLADGVLKTWDMSLLTIKMMAKMLVGEASVKNLSGPLSIADHAGKSAHNGFIAYALFLAVVSVSLGVLNLLPIPVLDGGHLMYYLYEAITGHEPSSIWMDRFQRGGMTLLMGMMAIALFNDVARFLG